MKLTDGPNPLRVVTSPYIRHRVRFQLTPNSKGMGKLLPTAYPAQPCPARQAGMTPVKRWIMGVIDRSETSTDPRAALKVLEVGSSVYTALCSLKSDEDWGDPTTFEIKIIRDSNAPPANYYTVNPRKIEPLSAIDLELMETMGEQLEATLENLSAPVDPELVIKLMEKEGWAPGMATGDAAPNGAAQPAVPVPSGGDVFTIPKTAGSGPPF